MGEANTAVAPQNETKTELQPKAALLVGETGIQLTDLGSLMRAAEMVFISNLRPNGMKTREDIAIAIQCGLEVGLPWMMAVQNIAVINGRPSVYGDVAKAIVERSNVCDVFHETPIGDPFPSDTFGWRCVIKRKGRADAVVREFTIADAKMAKLYPSEKSDSAWHKYPKRMCMWRARGWCMRDAVPDVLRGMRIAEEERDAIEVSFSEVAPKQLPSTSLDAATARLTEKTAPEPKDDGLGDEPEALSQGLCASCGTAAPMDILDGRNWCPNCVENESAALANPTTDAGMRKKK